MDPVPDPLLLRKSGSAGNRTRDLCICSQKTVLKIPQHNVYNTPTPTAPPMEAQHQSSVKLFPTMNYPHTKQPKYKQLSMKTKQCIGASQLPPSTARQDTAFLLANIEGFFLNSWQQIPCWGRLERETYTLGLQTDYNERAKPMACYERQQLRLHQ